MVRRDATVGANRRAANLYIRSEGRLPNLAQEEKSMPLYLDEIYFNVASKDDFRKVYDLINGAVTNGFPPGVTLKAGPYASNEDAKVVLILDIQDHALTFPAFSGALTQGIVARRRLSPLVDWATFEKCVKSS
jgi:hypothetical protein